MITPYVSISEAEEYFNTRLRTEAWQHATLDDREKSIMQATRAINQLDYIGTKIDENEFPRNDDNGVLIDTGDDITIACCEIALAYLSGVDNDHEFANIRVVSHSQDFSKTMYDKNSPPEHMIAGIPHIDAWNRLLPYLRDNRTVRLIRR